MDWTLAIRRNREQLKAIVLALFVLAGMRVGGSLFTLHRDIFAAILAVLRPAESAVRRLIVIAAHGLTVQPRPLAGPEAGETRGSPWQVGATGRGGQAGRKAFQLFDPLKSFDPESIWDVEPVWESQLGSSDPTFHYTSTIETPLDASHIGQRLNALIRALDNLPAQARRLVRWQQRRDAALKSLMLRCEQREPRSTHGWSPRRLSPMRPGFPPGWRQKRIHEVDDVLKECHGLASDRLNAP